MAELYPLPDNWDCECDTPRHGVTPAHRRGNRNSRKDAVASDTHATQSYTPHGDNNPACKEWGSFPADHTRDLANAGTPVTHAPPSMAHPPHSEQDSSGEWVVWAWACGAYQAVEVQKRGRGGRGGEEGIHLLTPSAKPSGEVCVGWTALQGSNATPWTSQAWPR